MNTHAEYIYHATNNIKGVLGSYNDKTPLNLIMGFQAIGYRSIMSSPNLLRSWMLQDILHGAPVGFVVVGTFNHYECREFIPILNDLYGFHKENEKVFTNLHTLNNIAVIQGRGRDAQGIIQLLSEEHILYDVISPDKIMSENIPRNIEDYEVLILNNISNMSAELIEKIDKYVESGGKLLVTGMTSINDEYGNPTNKIRLQSLGVEPNFEVFEKSQATYLKVSDTDKQILDQSKNFTLMMMHSTFLKCDLKEGAEGYLKLLPTNMYGPSEVTWYSDDEITDYPGVISYLFGKGKTVYLPWMLGTEYLEKGNYAQRSLFLGCLYNLLEVEKTIFTDAPAQVEITHLLNRNKKFEWVGMINHSGFHSTSVREPITIHNTSIRFRPFKPVKEVILLRSGKKVKFENIDGWIHCVIPELSDFELLLCIY
jgi:hypothetical protein